MIKKIYLLISFAFVIFLSIHNVQADDWTHTSCTGPNGTALKNACETTGTAQCSLRCNANGTWNCNPQSCRDSISGPCPANAPAGSCTPVIPRCEVCGNTGNFSCHTCRAAGTNIGAPHCDNTPDGAGKCHNIVDQDDGQCGVKTNQTVGECTCPVTPTAVPTLTPVPTTPPAPPVCGPTDQCSICTSPASCTVGQPCRIWGGPAYAICADGKTGGYCYNDDTCRENTPPPVKTVTPPPQNTPTPPPSACFIGKSCSNCSGNSAECRPDCSGGWCNNGSCSTCAPGNGGNGDCFKGRVCDAPPAGTTPTVVNGLSCYSVNYPNAVGQCCKPVSAPRTTPWEVNSCGAVTPVPPTPTPTYIAVENVVTPTPKPRNPGQAAQSWKCLRAVPYDTNGGVLPDGDPDHNDHLLTLSGSPLPDDTRLYIVGCVLLNGSFKCTTGNSSYDSILQISKAPEHEFAVAGGALKRSVDNKLEDIVIRSKTETSTTHTFFAVFDPDANGDDNDQAGNSLQLGTLNVNSSTVTTKCLAVRWDPYGRVFDAKSLEPISDIDIEVLNGSKQLVNLPGLTNPSVTDKAGGFNFLVEPGTYFLNLLNLKNYKVADQKSISPDYTKAYSDIYKPGTPIVEKPGVPEHRDIALDPGKNKPRQYSPVSIEFTILPLTDTNQTKLVGKVSHPLTLVYFQQNSREIGKTVADKFGFYELDISNDKIIPGISIVPYFKKVPLTTILPDPNRSFFEKATDFLASMFKRTSAAPEPASGAATEPLPSYLEGEVTTGIGQKLPKATVELRLKMSDETVYVTTADVNGIVRILPQYMPIFPFYLVVTPENTKETFTMTLSNFIEKNLSYLEKNKINLMTGTKDGHKIE